MKIAVFGTELQSYVAAACFASVGNQVDFFSSSLEIYQREPGLVSLFDLQKNAARIRIRKLQLDTEELSVYDFVIITGHSIQKLVPLLQSSLATAISHDTIIIILSPSEVGEAIKLSNILNVNTTATTTTVCSVPLLIREGRALQDFTRPDNIIIGCDKSSFLQKIRMLFYPFNRVKDVIREVTTKEAEFSCFAGNAMLATRISFMNEMANLAEKSGVDIDVIRECIGSDPRIGRDYLYPGCGYGGIALEENVAKVAKELSCRTDDLGLLEVVAKINERQKDLLFRKIWNFFNTDLQDKTVAVWGLSFKPGSASVDGAPAVKLVESLLAQLVKVKVYDPLASEKFKELFASNNQAENLIISNSAVEAIKGADVLAICTEWKEFWSPDFENLAKSLAYKVVFDGRNLYDPAMLAGYGIRYFGIGKGTY